MAWAIRAVLMTLARLIEHFRRLHEKGTDSHRLRQYVQRWVSWLQGGLQGAVTENRFNQIWDYVNKNYLAETGEPKNVGLFGIVRKWGLLL